MMKEEFENILGKEVSMDEYEEIEYVYIWHPAIKNTDGKDQIAKIFNAGGMMVIRSMREVAAMAEVLNNELGEELRKIEKLKKRIQRLESGDTSYERCLKDMKKALNMVTTRDQLEKLFGNMMEEYEVEIVNEARQMLNV